MWQQNPYGQPQYPQQSYQFNQIPQIPYGNISSMNNNIQLSTEAIDWDGVAAIDPDLIKMTGDLTQLQPFISKFVSANLTTYESQVLTHPLSIRLCSILQVSLRYMSDVQKQLQSKIDEKDRQISKQQHEFKKLAASYAKSDELLRKQMRPSERCPLCLKRFKNFDFLDQHIERRHAEHLDEWLSIRNKRPMAKQNQNDINNIMERIDALQRSIRKDREKRGHHHNRRNKNDNDENIQTLHQELLNQQDQLMATEAMEDDILMSKRDDMKSELDTAVDELNASWIAWSNNNKKNKSNSNQPKKPSSDADELNNMYNFNDNIANKFDPVDDHFQLNDNFNSNCHSDDEDPFKNQNFDENPMNHFQFPMLQNSEVPNQNQNVENKEEKHKKPKKAKRSLFGRKKSKQNLDSEQPQQTDILINDSNPYSNLNEFSTAQNIESNISKKSKKLKKSKQKSSNFQHQTRLPPKKKTLPDDVKELIAKARTIVLRKFTPSYDESTVNHVMKSIEKKMNGLRQRVAVNNETPEQVAEALQTNIDGDQNEYFAMRRKVFLKIDNEAPVKHCTLFDSSFTESSAASTTHLVEKPVLSQNIPIQDQKQLNTPIQIQNESQTQTQDQITSQIQVHISSDNQNHQVKRKHKSHQQYQQQQQQQQQNTSQSSISAKNKRNDNVSINIDDIPKPNNSQFTTSYSNYVSTSVSTTISPSHTPINNENKKPPKSSYSYIQSNSNINEVVVAQNQSQDQSKSTENPADVDNTKKLQFVKPRPITQCKKHFKSAGHTVQSPFPMLSSPTISKDNSNDVVQADINNQNLKVNGEEVEYIYEDEEEEEEEEYQGTDNNQNANANIVNDTIDQVNNENNSNADLIVVAEEEENDDDDHVEPTSNFSKQQVIQSETVEDETYDESKILNNQIILQPRFNKKVKNEITSSTDIMFEEYNSQAKPQKPPNLNSNRAKNELTSSTDTLYEVQQHKLQQIIDNKNSFDSLDQTDERSNNNNNNSNISNNISLQQQQQQQPQLLPTEQQVLKTPPNNNVIITIGNNNINNNITETTNTTNAQYEYEYYTDEDETKSDGEVANYQQQKEEIEKVEKIEKEIENEEKILNDEIEQQKSSKNISKSDLEPFIVSGENVPQKSDSKLNQNSVAHSEFYSSSSTNLFYKFDSSTNSKSRSKMMQDEAENEVEVEKVPTEEKPVEQHVYKSGNVGSMDNIVSFDEVKSIESIENIRRNNEVSNDIAQSSEDSKFNFDSLVEQSNGGDSFISSSMSQSKPLLQQSNMRSNDGSFLKASSNKPTQQAVQQQASNAGITNNNISDSFVAKQRSLLASKYGAPPSSQQPIAAEASVQRPPFVQSSCNKAAADDGNDGDDDGYEYEEEEEEEEEEAENYEFEKQSRNKGHGNQGSAIGIGGGGGSNTGIQKKFNVIDMFKQSSNSSLLKFQKSNRSFLGSKVQKTFVGSSSAAQDDDDFDYSRGPPMKENDNEDINSKFGDDVFGGGDFNNRNDISTDKESSFKKSSGLSKFVDDSEGPPLLSKRNDQDSLISNNDFNL